MRHPHFRPPSPTLATLLLAGALAAPTVALDAQARPAARPVADVRGAPAATAMAVTSPVREAYRAAYDAHDGDAVFRLLARDYAEVRPEGMQRGMTVHQMRETAARWGRITEMRAFDAARSGDLAYESGTVTIARDGEAAGGAARTERMRYTTVLVREDGAWRIRSMTLVPAAEGAR